MRSNGRASKRRERREKKMRNLFFLNSLFYAHTYDRETFNGIPMKKMLPLVLSVFFLVLPLQAAPKPQSNLPKATLTLGTNSLNAQIAADDASRELGLMSRTNLGTDEAMVFVFPSPRQVTFWMKDTPLPLSIAYVGRSGMIYEIHDMKPFDETPIPSASSTVIYAIETPLGWFEKHGVMAGSTVGGLPPPTVAK
jgi:uncharacterized membrane protein (UPF0127 family)